VIQHGKKQQKSEKEITLAYLQHKADAEISPMSKKILSTFLVTRASRLRCFARQS